MLPALGSTSSRSLAWNREPPLRETLLLWALSGAIFVAFTSALTPYLALVEHFGDSSAYMSIGAAIRTWDFHGVLIKHFWGLPYFMAAFSKLTGTSDRTAILLISGVASGIAVFLAHRLWGGWIATLFAIINFDWLQRSYLGGSEPLFVALLFGSMCAIRRERWNVAALLAALATTTRPLGVFLLLGIGVALLLLREWKKFASATAIGLLIAALYVYPLAHYFHDPLATVHSYQSTQASATVPLFGFPFYAIVRGTILYPAPATNLMLSFGWIALVLAGTVAMLCSKRFRQYARQHIAEAIFVFPYLASLYCYNYPVWARSNFARFAIPIVPFVLLALDRWLPRDRRVLWMLAPITAVLAASSAIGIQNVMQILKTHL